MIEKVMAYDLNRERMYAPYHRWRVEPSPASSCASPDDSCRRHRRTSCDAMARSLSRATVLAQKIHARTVRPHW